MQTIYLDNAATSFPKPPVVGARMREYVDQIGASVNRGSYEAAQQAELVTPACGSVCVSCFLFLPYSM